MRFCISYQLTILDASTYGFTNSRHAEKSSEVELDQLTERKLPHSWSRHDSSNWSSYICCNNYVFSVTVNN